MSVSAAVKIRGRWVGPGHPVYIIAEAGVNHNGDLATACRLVDVAAEAGADAVKFQTFKAENLATLTAPKANYQRSTTDPAESQLQMLRGLELSAAQFGELRDYCHECDIEFLSTPFDEASADLLEALDVPAYKVPSGEITNLGLLCHIAGKARPLILSTGMATLAEVETALDTASAAGNGEVILLHCVSSYPAPPNEANLRAMQTLTRAFRVPVGFSDHTLGLEVALAAVALGACVVEKHFTLDRTLPGPDHAASLTPLELRQLVAAIRNVEAALGDGCKRPTPSEADTRMVARKSVTLLADLEEGRVLEPFMLGLRRPGNGIAPAEMGRVVGRRLSTGAMAGTTLTWEMLT